MKKWQGLGCLREQRERSQEVEEQMSLMWRKLHLELNLQWPYLKNRQMGLVGAAAIFKILLNKNK